MDSFYYGGGLDFSEMDYEPFTPSSSRALLDRFGENATALAEALQNADDDLLTAEWTMRSGETILGIVPRHRAIRETSLLHLAHHRGQLTVYLRMLDVPVPKTYGPTADFPDFEMPTAS